jgi:hypothetical protein
VEPAASSLRALSPGSEDRIGVVNPSPTCTADGGLSGRTRGLISLVGAAVHGFGGKKSVEVVVVGDRCFSMASRAESRVRGYPGPVVGMEHKDVELLFEQLWHIPQHLYKPAPREVAHIKPQVVARVRSPPPPPPLPPDRP